MSNQAVNSVDILKEVLMAPSNQIINDRFKVSDTAAPCGTNCGAGCGGGCGTGG